MHLVRELLQSKPARLITADPQISVAEAMRIMREHTVRSILLTSDGSLRGIMTDKDYLRKVAACGGNPHEVRVEEVMTRSVTTITPEDTIQTCMTLMADHTLHHLPVVDEGKLVGMVSWTDIMARMLADA